jgi:hypothetical protein
MTLIHNGRALPKVRFRAVCGALLPALLPGSVAVPCLRLGAVAGGQMPRLVIFRQSPLCLISLLSQGCGSGNGPGFVKEDAREWRNGRRAGFRCQYPKGCGGSNPPSRTQMEEPRSMDRGSFAFGAFYRLTSGQPEARGGWTGPGYGRAEALNRRRELARWLRMAAAAAASSPSAMASEMERCSWTTWSKWSRA